MKLRYLGLEQELIHEEYNTNLVPGIGDMVWFDEAFYIEHIVWYPKEGMVQVYLTDEKPTRKKPIAESKEPVVKSKDIKEALELAEEAAKDVRSLKREVFTIRQHLKTRKES
jgi:hypothetical protein